MRWLLTAKHHTVQDADGNTLANIPPWVVDRDDLAGLMAAAPELYDALELCVAHLRDMRAVDLYTSGGFDAIEQADEILRKIRGEQS